MRVMKRSLGRRMEGHSEGAAWGTQDGEGILAVTYTPWH